MNCVTPGAMKDTLEVKAAYLSFVKYLREDILDCV